MSKRSRPSFDPSRLPHSAVDETPGPTVTGSATAVAEEAPTRRRNLPPTPEQIRRRAYEIYMARRGAPGNPEADWLQAERELRGAADRA